MTKVGKSDGEGTFAGVPGNDEVAPIPDLPDPAPKGKFDTKLPFAAHETSAGRGPLRSLPKALSAVASCHSFPRNWSAKMLAYPYLHCRRDC